MALSNFDHLHDYMSYRAHLEGTKHELSKDYYRSAFATGLREFFGVVVDDKAVMLADGQNPDAFRSFNIYHIWKG